MTEASLEPGSSCQAHATHAPERPLPTTSLYSVEYPGYVGPDSVPTAIRHLGGQKSLNRAFRRNATKTESILELNWRPDNPFAHKIPGESVHASNILLKVTKRKRRASSNASSEDSPIGEFTVEAVGVIMRTVRFRSMADFQYCPDLNDPVAQLRLAMERLDADVIRNYIVPQEKEDYTITTKAAPDEEPSTRSNLRMLPPPMFSRQGIFQNYNFKPNNMSIITTIVDEETGAEKKRLINKQRARGIGSVNLTYSEQKIPTEPPQSVREMERHVDQRILTLLRQRFEERPCWTRVALYNTLDPQDVRAINNSKEMLALVSYTFQDGPWRDTSLQYGYDPRTQPGARFYQRVYFRNLNHQIVRTSVTARRQENRHGLAQSAHQAESQDVVRAQSHIFDGVNLTSETPAFQFCDIHDPMLKEMIEDEDAVRDECNERDGWYTTHAMERIKAVLRHKFFSLLDGHIATEEECLALLQPGQNTAVATITCETRRRYPHKHNMAKGALRPEDAAVERLRAKLESARSRKPPE